MPKPIFSPADILAIREQAAAGTLLPREWAKARQCSIETVRRIARGESYTRISEAPSAGGEPDEAALAASFERMREVAQSIPTREEANSLLDELAKRGKT